MLKFISQFIATVVVALVFTGTSAAQTTSANAADTTVTVKVAGITCGSDLPLINNRVKKEEGVVECKAVGKASASTTFEVTYDPAVISHKEVVAAIEDAPSCDFPDQKPYKVKGKK